MKVRYIGHSCVEIVGEHHILIDPDFVRQPDDGVDYICITHAHKDHIGRVAEVPAGYIVASSDVCEIAAGLGVGRERLMPVEPGQQIANIQILPGHSRVNDPVYSFFYMLFQRRRVEPGGTPLSFLVHDRASLLHIGDAHDAPLPVNPDILCLPWRTIPFRDEKYKDTLINMAKKFDPPYILPVHGDLSGSEANPDELDDRLHAEILKGSDWFYFFDRVRVENTR